MADEQGKGVHVMHVVTGGGETFYPTATKFHVSTDGHLTVHRGNQATLAVYPPGKWQRAELKE
jgi:hypothetical protein